MKNKILCKENILKTFHSLDSYVELKHFSDDLKKDLFEYSDKYNENVIDTIIKGVSEKLLNIIEKDGYFKVNVIRKIKSVDDNDNFTYRYIHQPKSLIDLIAMMSILNVFVFKENEKNSLTSKIPSNFYGQIISDGIDKFYEPWNIMYKKYQEENIELLNEYTKTYEYKYMLNLDFKNFFPTINPFIVMSIIGKELNLNKQELDILKKLLIVKVDFENGVNTNNYYNGIQHNTKYSIGLPQGLPQSGHFANVVMMNITPIISKEVEGKSIYYVDDSVIYTNKEKLNIQALNNNINDYLNNHLKKDKVLFENQKVKDSIENYKLEIHDFDLNGNSKTTLTNLRELETFDKTLFSLGKTTSNISFEMFLSSSKDEEKSLLSKSKALTQLISKEMEKIRNLDSSYSNQSQLKFLEKLKRFFKYREIRLNDKVNEKYIERLYSELIEDFNIIEKFETNKEKIEYIDDNLIILRLELFNQINIDDKLKKQLIEKIKQLKDYENFTLLIHLPKELIKRQDYYLFMINRIKKNVIRSYVNRDNLTDIIELLFNKEFFLEIFFDLKNVDLYNMLFQNSKIFKRLIINIIISTFFDITPSDKYSFIKNTNKPIKYKELRILTYVRNKHTDINYFKKYYYTELRNNILNINETNVDYTIFEVLSIFINNIREYELIDTLIFTHHFVHSLWSNGSILFKYYTLHNEIHAIKLINIITKLTIYIENQTLSYYEKYLLYLSAYLHDISMADMPKKDKYDFKVIKNKHYLELLQSLNSIDTIEDIDNFEHIFREVEKYSKIYFDSLVNFTRKNHAKFSKEKINNFKELNYMTISEKSLVARLSEAHTFDLPKIIVANFEKNDNFDLYKLVFILRLADVLDITNERTYEIVLNNSFDFMSDFTKYQWLSHLSTKSMNIESDYMFSNNERKIQENININVRLKYNELESSFLDNDNYNIKFEKINSNNYKISLNSNEKSKIELPLIVKWFLDKNYYLIKELSNFENLINYYYDNLIYDTKIFINIEVLDEKISKEKLEIIKSQINGG